MNTNLTFSFEDAALTSTLAILGPDDLDLLDFGVIGMDAAGIVRKYNAIESQHAGLAKGRVIGFPLFTAVAPCMNNFLVAQRFEDAATLGLVLDDTIDYVLTLRMRPVKVKLRLISVPGQAYRFVLVQRRA